MAADDPSAPAEQPEKPAAETDVSDGQETSSTPVSAAEHLAHAKRLLALRRHDAARRICLALLDRRRSQPTDHPCDETADALSEAELNTLLLLLLRIARDDGSWQSEWDRACSVVGGIPMLSEELLCLGALEFLKAGEYASARATIELWLSSQPDEYFDRAAASTSASTNQNCHRYAHVAELYLLALAGLGDYVAGSEFLAQNVTLDAKQKQAMSDRLEQLRLQALDASAKAAIESAAEITLSATSVSEPVDSIEKSTKTQSNSPQSATIGHDLSSIASKISTSASQTTNLIRKFAMSLSSTTRRALVHFYHQLQQWRAMINRQFATNIGGLDPAVALVGLVTAILSGVFYGLLRSHTGELRRILPLVRGRMVSSPKNGLITHGSSA